MTKAKYRTAKHKQVIAQYAALIKAGRGWCAETVCLIERDGGTRFIPPTTPRRQWNAAHTDDGLAYKGPAHERCNKSEGASRGNRMRAGKATLVRRRAL